MECNYYLQGDQDLLADGKSQNVRRLWESFQDMLCSREEFWEEDILIAEIGDLEKRDASENYSRRLNAKEVLITQKTWRINFFLWQMVQQNYQEETANSKNPL